MHAGESLRKKRVRPGVSTTSWQVTGWFVHDRHFGGKETGLSGLGDGRRDLCVVGRSAGLLQGKGYARSSLETKGWAHDG